MDFYILAFLLLFQFLFGCNQASEFPQASQLPDNQQNQKRDKTGDANIVFKSTDGGQRLVKTSFVAILTAFTGHQTREKHGNWYILPQKGRCSYYLFPAT
jgi:hypothetical protein